MSDLFSLHGRTAVLTGAGGFLGGAMAQALLGAGAHLVAVGRPGRLDRAADGWAREHGDRVRVVHADLADAVALDAALDQVAGGPVDVLVNNAHTLDRTAGFNVDAGRLAHLDLPVWQAHLDGGPWWAARATQRLLTPLTAARGSVVNVSSMYGVVAPNPRLYEGTDKVNPLPYAVAKAAMLALTRSLAAELGAAGVRVNALLPGPFSNVGGDSDNSVDADDPFLARLHDRTLLGRTGRADELAGPLLFLASTASSYVTGHALVVDGGWTVT